MGFEIGVKVIFLFFWKVIVCIFKGFCRCYTVNSFSGAVIFFGRRVVFDRAVILFYVYKYISYSLLFLLYLVVLGEGLEGRVVVL